MPSFILRGLDPIFWSRVQAKAKAEGIQVKALILKLLTTWLGVLVVTIEQDKLVHQGGPEMTVNIGDTIRFSVALLQQLYEEPDHLSELVTVRYIGEAADGSKTLMLERVPLAQVAAK